MIEPLGGETLIHLPLGAHSIRVRQEGPATTAAAAQVRIGFDLADAHFFDRSGQAIP